MYKNTIFWPQKILFSGSVVQGRYLQNWNIINKTWNPNIHILKPLSRVHNDLHLNVVTFWFEGIKLVTKTWAFGFCTWIYIASMVPWTNNMPQKSLNPSMTSIESLPSCHFIWFFKTEFIAHINQCRTRWTINFLIANNSKKCKYLDACASLYKLHTTWILIIIVLNSEFHVFFFSMKGFNFFIKWWTKFLLTQKCSIHLRSLYCIIKKCGY
jgi:hypothetical protein